MLKTILTAFSKITFLIFLSGHFLQEVTVSQSIEGHKDTFFFEWGNNIWGNTISIGYNYSFSEHIYGGISLGRGYFQNNIPNDGNSIFVANPPGKDNTFSLTFHQIINLRIGYVIKQHEGLRIFNKFETGLSYMHFTFEDIFTDKYYFKPEVWKGSKEYNLYSLMCAVNILDYVPKFNSRLNFDFGFNTRITFTDNQKLVYQNPLLGSWEISYLSGNNSTIYWIYPELYLRICCSL